MPARTWFDLMSAEEVEATREADRALGPEWSIDYPGYANPHEFDRAAVGDFLSREWHDEGSDLAEVYRVHHPSLTTPLSHARRDLLSQWLQSATSTPSEPGWVCASAAQYLDARGYPMERLFALAEPVRTVLDGLTVREGAHLPAHDPDSGFDDLDYVLVAALAGLTAPEIETLLVTGSWPDPEALYLLHALA